jgi:outer membrane protein OmpA-like peptidoglycan-associated protein
VGICLLMAAVGCKKSEPASQESPSASAAARSPDGGDQPQSLAERLKAVQSGQADGTGKPALPDWKAAASGAASPGIPLVAGLMVVTAVSDEKGDYESIKTITDVSPTAVTMGYSADVKAPKMTGMLGGAQGGLADPKNEFPDKVRCVRLIDVPDLKTAHSYSELFCQNPSEHFPGSTSIGSSTEVLDQLRAGQQTEFHFGSDDKMALFLQIGEQASGHKLSGPLLTQHAGQQMYSCNLHRVEPGDLAVPVMLNDQRVELPALHAMCTLDDNEEAHMYLLDQEANPITLAFQLGPVEARLQVIRITVPPPEAERKNPALAAGAGSQMEKALADKKPVEVYGIYFDFNSAIIKPESEQVLQQIADIMQKNPDWKLAVNGHTDNIGGDSFNQGLSERRAAAVKDALVTRYKISPDRLATAGYGASQPIETNKTMEGRARNRRVELKRQ